MTLEAIRYQNGTLEILDQLLLPAETKYIPILGVEDGWKAINKMQVRGAPAIAIVGCLSLAVELSKEEFEKKKTLRREVEGKLNYLISARPTAVNLKLAADDLMALVNSLDHDDSVTAVDMQARFISEIESMLEKDLADNRAIGEAGADLIINAYLQHQQFGGDHPLRVLTHCNTGTLATSGYGTALGVIRSLHARKNLDHVYCTETRPYNQGARLTAYELVYEKIPSTLICDSAVSALMKAQSIAAVIVGADRVATNGDVANKIGTYQIAVAAKYHSVPFYVAAPFTSIDFSVASGENIHIEERPDREMTHIGKYRIAAHGVACWNPAFDVTPAELITAIITEKGPFSPSELRNYRPYLNSSSSSAANGDTSMS